MDISRDDLMWLAGWLEGEGCFRYAGTPRVQVQATDEDVVRRGAAIIGAKHVIEIRKELKNGWPQSVVGEAFGVSRRAISFIATGKTWSHVQEAA